MRGGQGKTGKRREGGLGGEWEPRKVESGRREALEKGSKESAEGSGEGESGGQRGK